MRLICRRVRCFWVCVLWRLCFVIVATHHTRAHGMSKRNFISSQSLESDSGMAGSPSALPVTASARRSPRHTPSITKRPSNIAAPNGSPPALPASQYNAQSSFTLLTQVMSSAPPTPTVLPSPVVPVVPPPPRAALPPPHLLCEGVRRRPPAHSVPPTRSHHLTR